MARHEKYGNRDLTFSTWHRTLSDDATCIDIDFCEYCRRCRQPLALIEIARDVGQPYKATIVLSKLADQASIPGYLVLYKLDPKSQHGIGRCRFQQVAPNRSEFVITTIDVIGRRIEKIHSDHICKQGN